MVATYSNTNEQISRQKVQIRQHDLQKAEWRRNNFESPLRILSQSRGMKLWRILITKKKDMSEQSDYLLSRLSDKDAHIEELKETIMKLKRELLDTHDWISEYLAAEKNNLFAMGKLQAQIFHTVSKHDNSVH